MATIIRSGGAKNEPATDSMQPLTFTLSNMSQQGDDYVKHVRSEAAKEVQAAKDQAGSIRKKAEEEGRAKAASEADQRLQQVTAERLKSLQPAVESAIRQIVDARGEWLAHWESAAVQLAAQIAERVIRRELNKAPEISSQWVREALELSAGASDVTVRLNPTDHQNGATYIEQLTNSMQGLGEARVVADESIEPGGCVVDTRYGRVDNGLSAQLERLTTELL